MIFHLEDTLLATSFIKSDSSGSLPSPAYFFPKPVHEERTATVKLTTIHTGIKYRYSENLHCHKIALLACKTHFSEHNHFQGLWTLAEQVRVELRG